jgi:transcriptional regulator with XRE-family HTH domain
MASTIARHAVPRGSLADRVRRNIARRTRELGMNQTQAAQRFGLSQQAFSDRSRGRTPWTLVEIDFATTTLEMDLSAILAPVDDDLELSLFEPLDQDADDDVPAVKNIVAAAVVAT